MKFEEALAAMREGEKLANPSLESFGSYLRMDIGMVMVTIMCVYYGGARTVWKPDVQAILREDWEIITTD